jgi:hypothetical protein
MRRPLGGSITEGWLDCAAGPLSGALVALEGFRINAIGPGACAARAGRLGGPERLISTQYHRRSATRGNRG